MARRRRQARRRGPLAGLGLPPISPEVSRSLVGITLLVLGAVTLIALLLPGQGSLTTWWIGTVAPWFGSLRWLLPFLLIAAGWYVEWGPGKAPSSGWGLTLVGVAIAYAGILGAATVIRPVAGKVGAAGGWIGTFLADLLSSLFTSPGALVLLIALAIVGVLLAFNLRLRDLAGPGVRWVRWLGESTAASMQRSAADARPASGRRNGEPDGEVATLRGGGRARAARIAGTPSPAAGQTGIWGEEGPAPVPAATPVSATFAPPRAGGNGTA
ncbi:MAG TPA: DNA translocase FtsK 4TM domain-containing protein, partial [Candidatus Limnocylindrales bacterium]|nr:DNA translocase FtsK 4TM domain-containing protein [Candidatus Limnocylindrales bacterium]